jgi:PAS domain-containing protein
VLNPFDTCLHLLLIARLTADSYYSYRFLPDLCYTKNTHITLTNNPDTHHCASSMEGDIIFQTEAAGRWTFLNNAWTEIAGFSVAESLGQDVQGCCVT